MTGAVFKMHDTSTSAASKRRARLTSTLSERHHKSPGTALKDTLNLVLCLKDTINLVLCLKDMITLVLC